jgi:hypothetical protein
VKVQVIKEVHPCDEDESPQEITKERERKKERQQECEEELNT